MFSSLLIAQNTPVERADFRTEVLRRNLDLTVSQQNAINEIFLKFEKQYDIHIELYKGNTEGLVKAMELNESRLIKDIVRELNSSQVEMYEILVFNNYEVNAKNVGNNRNSRFYSVEK
jgi:hypothetical protein